MPATQEMQGPRNRVPYTARGSQEIPQGSSVPQLEAPGDRPPPYATTPGPSNAPGNRPPPYATDPGPSNAPVFGGDPFGQHSAAINEGFQMDNNQVY